MMWFQKEIVLNGRARGLHLITHEIVEAVPELADFQVGLAHIFIQHTSASLTISESYDPEVRVDVRNWLDRIAPENEPWYTHTLEGSDDMPSHLKSILTGTELTVPITNGKLNLGTWQGIWLCEHRDRGGRRCLVITIQGKSPRAQT